MLSKRLAFALALTLVAFGGLSAIACGGSSSSSTPTPGKTTAPGATATKAAASGTGTPAASGTAPAQASVTIKDFAFSPPSVTIQVGGTVTWTNNGPSAHTATADDGSFDSGSLAAGKTFQHTFQTAGTFSYHCTIHPFMTAEVVVQSGSSASTLPGY
ncbi:MAG: cupredoxin family copper-binding protein [Dehalococcoidia bacterium]|jgi:plastocyanin